MSLINPVELFSIARKGGFALGFFESWDISSTQGVIDAAEEANCPIIIGFNGEFMSGNGRVAEERIEWYGALGRAAAESARVPCGFIFNECPKDDWVRRAVDTGFNIVMPDDPSADVADYRRRVGDLTEYAHAKGVAVEAGLADLPSGASGQVVGEQHLTVVREAVDFVTDTKVDLLSVSVGNVHIRLSGSQSLDLDRLGELTKAVDAGIVLHGGTGIPLSDLQKAVAAGVVKVNFGTYLKLAWLNAMRSAFKVEEKNPHLLLGIGGPEDLLMLGRKAVKDAVLSRLEPLGCVGKASLYQ